MYRFYKEDLDEIEQEVNADYLDNKWETKNTC